MRRVIAKHQLDQRRPGTWLPGDWTWSTPQAACSDHALQKRSMVCRVNGADADDNLCAEAKPPVARTDGRYDGCTYAWAYGDYGDYDKTCSDTASRSRDATCTRTGGDAVPIPGTAQQCATSVATVVDGPVGYYPNCAYRWTQQTLGDPSSTCSPSATRPIIYACQRSGGDSRTAFVTGGNAHCEGGAPTGSTGPAPESSGCTGSWSIAWTNFGTCDGGVQQQQGTVSCKVGGQTVDDEFQCSKNAKPVSPTQNTACGNILEDPGFERATPGWGLTNTGGGSIAVSSEFAHTGTKSLKVRLSYNQTVTAASGYFQVDGGVLNQMYFWTGQPAGIPYCIRYDLYVYTGPSSRQLVSTNEYAAATCYKETSFSWVRANRNFKYGVAGQKYSVRLELVVRSVADYNSSNDPTYKNVVNYIDDFQVSRN